MNNRAEAARGGGSTHTGDTYEFYILKDVDSSGGCCAISAPSEPSKMIEYTGPNAEFTPAYMDYDLGEFNYGSWKDTWIMDLCRPCMMKATGVDYYLDPTDISKKKDDGSASDYNNIDYDGPGVFVEIDQVWIKEEDEEDRIHIWLSPTQQEGFDCLSHMDEDGNLCSHIYRGKYLGIYKETGAKSISGQDPTAEGNYDTAINQYASCTKWGKGWQCEDWSFLRLMQYLHLLVGKSTNTQEVFGWSGNYTPGGYDPAPITGSNDTKGLFYGTYSPDNNTDVTTFYMDNMWGYQERLLAGIYTLPNSYDTTSEACTNVIKMQPPYIIKDNLTEAELSEAGYTNQAQSITESGYIQAMKLYKGIGLLPYGTQPRVDFSHGDMQYWCDLAWLMPDGTNPGIVHAGGNPNNGYSGQSGLFSFNSSYQSNITAASGINYAYGFVPMFKLASA